MSTATRVKLCTAVSLISLIVGCTSSSHVPKSGITVEEVYYGDTESDSFYNPNSKLGSTNNMVPWRPTTNYERSETDVYTLHNSPRVPYRMLPNPTIYIYVPPKLSKKERIPIPGYFSEFKLMTKDEFALPGEVNLSNSERFVMDGEEY